MIITKVLKIFEIILIIFLLLVFALATVHNLHFFYVPNTDIFQYLCEARQYYHGLLPTTIHPQPLYSLLIYPISWLFRNSEFPEFVAGITINIFANLVTLFCFYKLSFKYLNSFLRILLMILLVSHPLFFYTSVNTTPEPLLLMFVSLSLLYYQKKPQGAYLFAVLAAFVKYEGFIILGALVAATVYNCFRYLKHKKLTIRLAKSFTRSNGIAIIAVLILGTWTVFVATYNLHKIGSPNFFIKEMATDAHLLPDLRKTTRLFDLLKANTAIFNTNYTDIDMFELVFLLLILTGITVKGIQGKDFQLLQTVFFVFGYLLVHTLFPAYNPRYFMPVLPFLFLLCAISIQSLFNQFRNKFSWLLFAGAFLLSVGWVVDLINYKYIDFLKMDQYMHAGKRLSGEWLNQYASDQDIIVISDGEMHMTSYLESSSIKYPFLSEGPRPLCEFTKTHQNSTGSSISYFEFSLNNEFGCNDALCIIRANQLVSSKVLILQTNNNLIKLSNLESDLEKSCFTLLFEKYIGSAYIKIYEFNTHCLQTS